MRAFGPLDLQDQRDPPAAGEGDRVRLLPCVLSMAVSLGLGAAHAAVPASEAGSDAGMDLGATEDFSATATLSFNESMLKFPVDTGLFAQGNALPAGTYRVDLFLNGDWKGRNNLRFEMRPGETRVAQPCFDLGLLDLLGVDLIQLTPRVRAMLQRGDTLCQPIGELIEGAFAHYDDSQLRLEISVPQIMLRREARGAIDPALWDHGVTAAFVDYSYNGYRRQSASARGDTSHYLGLRSGLNVGAWRLRHQASASHNAYSGFRYRGHSAQIERALPRLNSRLTLGDTVTDGRAFDSVRFRGVRIDSDDRMRPDSQRGFAPVVRGIAIVEAKHAGGARVTGQAGQARLNRRGHAVVSNLRPYRHNRIALDPKGLSTDVAIATTSRQTAPTAGAVALIRYDTERGYSLLLQGRKDDGQPLPFAAAVYDGQGRNVGHVSQGGQALLRVKQPQGTLQVRWGQGEQQRCQLSYSLGETPRRHTRQRNATVHTYRPVNATCLNNTVAALEWE